MLNRKLPTSNRRQQIHLRLGIQIISLSLESRMFLFLDHNDHITRLHARRLITLAVEPHLMAGPGALVDMHIQHLPLLRRLFTVTRLASVFGVHHLPRTLTFVTRLLDLLHHRADLAEHDFVALAATGSTLGDGPFLAAVPFAAFANGRFGQGEFLGFAFVQVFERDADAVHEVFAPAGSLGSAATYTLARVGV